jgi:hypothetical protein
MQRSPNKKGTRVLGHGCPGPSECPTAHVDRVVECQGMEKADMACDLASMLCTGRRGGHACAHEGMCARHQTLPHWSRTRLPTLGLPNVHRCT